MVLLKMGHPFKMLERIAVFYHGIIGEMYGHGGQIYSIFFVSPKNGSFQLLGVQRIGASAGLTNLGILEVFFAEKQWLFLVPIKWW